MTKGKRTDDLLVAREATYGDFEKLSLFSQRLKLTMVASENWGKLAHYQREALELIQLKVARILNGDPNYEDNWVDIAGYATLAAEQARKHGKR